MLYFDRIIPTSFLFILAKVAVVILSEFRAMQCLYPSMIVITQTVVHWSGSKFLDRRASANSEHP